MKKLLAILVIFIFAVNICCCAYSDVDDVDLQNDLQRLSDMNIIGGYEDGTFKPNNNITRAEFCKIIMSTIIVDSACSNDHVFKDISNHWAKEYIAIAAYYNIINGVTSTTFAPEDNITYEQAIKMIVAALGYNEEAISKGGYPEGYIEVACELGILNDLKVERTRKATRANIAKIVSNAIDIPFYFLINEEGTIYRELSPITLYEIFKIASSAPVDEGEEPYNEIGESSDIEHGSESELETVG